MIIVLKKNATKKQQEHITSQIEEWGLQSNVSVGAERTIVGVIGDEDLIRNKPLGAFPGVENVMEVMKPYKLVGREMHPESTLITIPPVNNDCDPVVFGGREIVVIAGPCSIENHQQLLEIAKAIKSSGARMLRGGAFKPRTSPYSFQGLGEEGLKIMRDVRNESGLPIITEVMDTKDVELVAEYSDMLQIGARNMQNFNLLKAVGQMRKPVMLKRGMANTIKELLMCAEYIMSEGNREVVVCERGMRTISEFTRNTLDLSAVPVIKRESHLPVMVDPSHAAGHWDLIEPLVLSSIAAGADSIMVEVHPNPEQAMSDGEQSLLPPRFGKIMKKASRVADAVDRSLRISD